MSDGPYKIRHIMQYTEVVYYQADGTEVDRERVIDDHTYDTGEPEPLTQQEIDDWMPEEDEPERTCKECGEEVVEVSGPFEGNGVGYTFTDGTVMCESCTHNAYRSGWNGEFGDG